MILGRVGYLVLLVGVLTLQGMLWLSGDLWDSLVYHLLHRAAWMVFVVSALHAELRRGFYLLRGGPLKGWYTFVGQATLIKVGDISSFVYLTLWSQGEVPLAVQVLGLCLGLVGVATTVTLSLRTGGRLWGWCTLFVPGFPTARDLRPLQVPFLVGVYLPALALTLVCGSLPGGVAVCLDLCGALILNRVVDQRLVLNLR